MGSELIEKSSSEIFVIILLQNFLSMTKKEVLQKPAFFFQNLIMTEIVLNIYFKMFSPLLKFPMKNNYFPAYY